MDAYVPADYIPGEAQKIDLHRRLALAESEDELRELRAAAEDRFGPVPEPVEHLFEIQEAKLKLARLGADYLVFRSRQDGDRPARARLGGAPRPPRAGRHRRLFERPERGHPEGRRVQDSAAAGRCYPRSAVGRLGLSSDVLSHPSQQLSAPARAHRGARACRMRRRRHELGRCSRRRNRRRR